MASTTSTSAICRRRSWIVTSQPPRKSAAWRSGARSPLCRATPFSLPADLTQEDQLPGLPIGTRGGVSTSYTFAQDGEYDIQILLARDLAGVVSGLREARPHELLVLLDREPVETFTISEASQRRRHAARQGFESARRREGRPAQHRASHSSRRAHRLSTRPGSRQNPASTTGGIRVRRPPSTRFR